MEFIAFLAFLWVLEKLFSVGRSSRNGTKPSDTDNGYRLKIDEAMKRQAEQQKLLQPTEPSRARTTQHRGNGSRPALNPALLPNVDGPRTRVERSGSAAPGHQSGDFDAPSLVMHGPTQHVQRVRGPRPSGESALQVNPARSGLAAIRQLTLARKIKHLIHFTQAENLPAILNFGLLGRISIDEKQIHSRFNDQYRFDQFPNAICSSISFPNYRMLYRLRCEKPGTNWVILRLNPDILWSKRCLFCTENAASRNVVDLGTEDRMGYSAFEAMFLDHTGMPAREALGIPDHFTTNPQAEVLVMDPIAASEIMDVVLDSPPNISHMESLERMIEPFREHFEFVHDADYFKPRSDYPHWQ